MLTDDEKAAARRYLEDHLLRGAFVIILSNKARTIVGNPPRATLVGTLEMAKAVFLQKFLSDMEPGPGGNGHPETDEGDG